MSAGMSVLFRKKSSGRRTSAARGSPWALNAAPMCSARAWPWAEAYSPENPSTPPDQSKWTSMATRGWSWLARVADPR